MIQAGQCSPAQISAPLSVSIPEFRAPFSPEAICTLVYGILAFGYLHPSLPLIEEKLAGKAEEGTSWFVARFMVIRRRL